MPTAPSGSPGRILTTFTGSLPRPDGLEQLLAAAARGEVDPEVAAKAADEAVAGAVAAQLRAGIDVISDGEMGTPSFMDARRRLTGFDGPMNPFVPGDCVDAQYMPDSAAAVAASGQDLLPSNNSADIAYMPEPVHAAIARFRKVLGRYPEAPRAFLAAPSPGTLARLGSSVLDYNSLLSAIARAMREEYRLITEAGFQVNIDGPDLAMCRHVDHQHLSVDEFLGIVRLNVEALNMALEGIDPAAARLHVCWGNYPGPHHLDVPLRAILPLLFEAHVGTLVIEQSNPQHRHEWRVFQDYPIDTAGDPPGSTTVTTIAVGVVSATTPHVEHPATIADDLVRLAGVVGKERLMAATDCGFSTFACAPETGPGVANLKLAALAEGARIASDILWG